MSADLKAPWKAERAPTDVGAMIVASDGEEIGFAYEMKSAPLFAAAPELLDALKGMVGLITMLGLRLDMPEGFRVSVEANHRVVTARELLAKMEAHQL